MLTKQQSQRRHKEMLIEEEDQADEQNKDYVKSGSSSAIKYFQGRTPSRHSDESGGSSRIKE